MAELCFQAAILAAIFISTLVMTISHSVADENLGSHCVYIKPTVPCSSPEINLISDKCNPSGSGNYSHNSLFESNLLSVFSNLTSAAAFYNASSGSDEDQVFGLFYCRGDVGPPDCLSCVQAGVSHLRNCTSRDGLAYYEQCTLRYAIRERDMFNAVELKQGNGSCVDYAGPYAPNNSMFQRTVEPMMKDLTLQVPLSRNSMSYFLTNSTELYQGEKVYGLVQCRPDLATSKCVDCLLEAWSQMRDNCLFYAQIWGMYFLSGCQIRYDLVPFYNLTPPTSSLPKAVMGPPNTSNCPGSSSGLWNITALTIILTISTFSSLIVSFKEDIFPFL